MPIINDVEVEECIFFAPKTIENNCHEQPIAKKCGTTPICYFKLLHKAYEEIERVKAENAELKNRLMILDEKTVTVQITTDEFEEFKNLKNENAKLKERKNDFFNQAEISHQAVLDKNKIIENLEKTLQEIKDLCQRQDLNQGMRYFEILKLIKKAEEQ